MGVDLLQVCFRTRTLPTQLQEFNLPKALTICHGAFIHVLGHECLYEDTKLCVIFAEDTGIKYRILRNSLNTEKSFIAYTLSKQ